MKKNIFILLFCFSSIAFFAQEKQWALLSEKAEEISNNQLFARNDMPKEYQLYSLETQNFKKKMGSVKKSNREIIEIPTRNGIKKFYVKESSNFNKKLASKFNEIVAYSGVQVDDSSIKLKFSKGLDGFHFSIYEPGKNTFYVDSYTKDNRKLIAYNRTDLIKEINNFTCNVNELTTNKIPLAKSNADVNDGLLRTYRLALACTGEYAQFHLNRLGISSAATVKAKKAAVLSAMNTTITRVNGVFERELSVRMEIVGNNDNLIFLDAATDNLTNNDVKVLIVESQAICDNIIGDANYDVGHTFSTVDGGFADRGVICKTGSKASGVTGISQPFGDEFDIDFVAHEFGHQFGSNHTFNSQSSSCGNRNINNATAVEPGSGTTIMGYAGLCAPHNIQNDSDDYFHAVSIAEMWSVITSTGTCAVNTPTGNSAPTADAGLDYSIPKSTPFVLKGTGTDADPGTALTYNWEQIDNQVGFPVPPTSANGGGAVFRSLPSSPSPNRYLPALPTVLSGSTSSTWESVPGVERDLNFSLTVRDNNSGGGSSARDDMKVTVTSANPFTVSAPNTAVFWDAGSTQTITWNKGTTDLAPINCANVNIKLSVDGGLTFPILLQSNTPNDGSQDVLIPNNPTSSARIMVEAANNIFYNVNATNFTINSTTPTFLFTDGSGIQYICNSGNNNAVYNLDLDFLNGFSEDVTFTTTGQPAGSNVSFNPNTINSDGQVVMTISNLNGKTPQPYTINVVATSNTVTQNLDAELNLTQTAFNPVTLVSPTDGEVDVQVSHELKWNINTNAVTYDVEVATDTNFSTIVANTNTSTNTFRPNNLTPSATYYWRVKPKNSCGEGDFSTVFSFQTELCEICTTSPNNDYDTGTTLVKFNTINNATPNKIAGYNDYTAMNTTLETNASYDLTVNVNTADDSDGTYATNTKVWIDWNQNCDFSDPGEEYDLGTASSTVDGPTSLSPLSITVPPNANLGNTIMRVATKFSGEREPAPCDVGSDGEVEDYTIIIDNVSSIPNGAFAHFNLYPNPSSGLVNLKFDIVDSNTVTVQLFDLRGRLIYDKKYDNITERFSKEISFDNASKGLYLLKITNGSEQTTKKLILK